MDFRKEIAKAVKSSLNVDVKELLEVPPSPSLGHYALPCFSFATKEKKSPVIIASEYAKAVDVPKFIQEIKSTGPYVNFFIKKEVFAKETLKKVTKDFAKGKKKVGKVMVEYSAPNIFKSFHIGHVRNTVLGESVSRVLRYNGHEVIQANYLNDKGAHIGKWIWYYKKHHKGELPKGNVEKWMADIYVKANKVAESEVAKKEIAKINKELIEGKAHQEILKKGKEWSMNIFYEIYDILGANFDIEFWESPLNKKANNVVDTLLKKGIAEESEGAVILNYEKYGLGVAVIRRKDGTNLYLTSDFALAQEKFDKYNITESIYVVGNEQSLHFKQLFKTLELLGYKNAKKCKHLGYELVRFPGRKMSSRTGDNKSFLEFFKEVKEVAYEGVDIRHPEWSKKQKEETGEDIAVAAIKFGMIKQDPNKVVIFDPDKEISFEGETGPYLQYTHARACSILRNAKPKSPKPEVLINDDEFIIITKLEEFSSTVKKAADDLRPNLIANYLLELTKLFNSFYQKHQVIQDDKELQNARLLLVEKVKVVIAEGLYLLGIKAPEQM